MSKSFRSNLRQWLNKVYSLGTKPKKTASTIARKLTNFDAKESKEMIQERIVNNLYQRFEDLKDREMTSANGMQMIEDFLQQHELQVNDKLQQMIVQYVQKFFDKSSENNSNYQEYVQNIWDDTTETYECVCPKTTKDLQFSQQKQACYRCQRSCHVNCFWGMEKEEHFECPMCFLRSCIPNKRVKKILFAGFLRQIKKDKIQYKINLPLEIDLTDDTIIEARCVRLCKDNRYEITWPINCSFYLNSKKIMDVKPLNNNSSIKKRIDDELILDKRLLSDRNTITIEEKHQYMQGFRPTVYENHLIILCQVQILSVEQMTASMMEERMPVEESKDILREYLDRGMHDCFIDQLKINLKCQFYNGKITLPARSKHCTSHYQPFDLKGFLMANINIRSSALRWKCPICKERAYHIVVDDYLLGFITSHKDLTQIEFNNKGDCKIVEQEESDNQSQKNILQDKIRNPQFEVIECEIQENRNPNSAFQRSQRQRQNQSRQFVELIEIVSEDEEQQQGTEKPKRGLNERGQIDEIESSGPQKRRKSASNQGKTNNLSFLRLKRTANLPNLKDNSQISSESDILDFQSKYSPENSLLDLKPERKERKERKNRKDRVFDEEIRKDLDKKSKILVPTPAISTVIPEAIRILEKKLPQVSKRVPVQVPTIDIDSQSDNEQNEETRKNLKIKHHLAQLEKQKDFLTQQAQKYEITPADELLFLSLCEKFMTASIKG